MKPMSNPEEIFYAALELPDADAIMAYLDEACAGDQALRAKVESLLALHERAGDFLETPAIDPGIAFSAAALAEGPGTVIGNFKLLEKIGEGGMAVVYVAEQQEPLQRKVALKLVKLGMDSEQVIVRFAAERQALALMDHPNIARVFDAGTTESGRPYFVMELVKGVSITQFCDKNQMSAPEQLDLFVQVCQAVQHAHQKGIIHRDLKPSNVMVTIHDGRPVPKVIDFGIAKATNRRLTEKTLFTHYAQIIGTPEYMSPEQAQMSDQDVDTRSDVYSLGVLLYELLIGKPPFDAAYLRSKSYAEIQRIIKEEAPTRPSTRMAQLALPNKSKIRNPQSKIDRDLDWIVMKTLEKDRNRRYASVSEFAADIQRHLNHEPVLAGPPSTWYCIKKYVQRHRSTITTAAAVGITLLIGLCASTYLLRRVKLAEAESRLSRIQKLYSVGQYQSALKEIETTLEELDLGPEGHLLQARMLLEVGQYEKAEETLSKLTHAELQSDAAAHFLLARVYLTVDAAKADQHAQLVESRLPQTLEAYYLRAMLAATPDEALEWLSQALEMDTTHYASRKAQMFIYYRLGQYQQMLRDAGELIVLRRNDYLGYALRAIAQRETDQLADAVDDYNKAIKLCHIPEERRRLYEQRYETHVRMRNYEAALTDARQYAGNEGSFPAFYALMALGRYAEAQAEYMQDAKLGARKANTFKANVDAYMLKRQNIGQDLVLLPDVALKPPFYYVQQALEFHRALSERGETLPISETSWLGDWSPDGRYIAYGRTGYRAHRLPGFQREMPNQVKNRCIEILDLETRRIRPITGFGNLPRWSPDGKNIAFVAGEPGEFHIWIVSSSGGDPQRIALGYSPHWSRDSKRIFFRIDDGTICSAAIDRPNQDPVPVLAYPGKFLSAFAISPDENLIALERHSEIHILTFPEGREVTRWTLPWPCDDYATQLRWHPNGKTVVFNTRYNQLGMCLFDVEEGTTTHVLNGTRPWCRTIWSPDGSQVIVDPHYSGDVWLLDIDPNRLLAETLGPAYSTEDFLAKLLRQWDERIQADPAYAENYVLRAIVLLAAQEDDRAEQDLNRCVQLINDPNDPGLHAISYWGHRYCGHNRQRETVMWAPVNVKLFERFPEHYQQLPDWYIPPYQQLMKSSAPRENRGK